MRLPRGLVDIPRRKIGRDGPLVNDGVVDGDVKEVHLEVDVVLVGPDNYVVTVVGILVEVQGERGPHR